MPDVAMNADQQDGVSSQEPFYSSLNTTKPATVKTVVPVTTAGGDYAKINQVRQNTKKSKVTSPLQEQICSPIKCKTIINSILETAPKQET